MGKEITSFTSFIGSLHEGTSEKQNEDRIIAIKLSRLVVGTSQPRSYFDEKRIEELAESMKVYGVINPLLVKKTSSGKYEVLAGERRLRAAKLCNLREVPCIEKVVDAAEASLIALVDNIQRENLNPIDEALAYEGIISRENISHEEFAELLGKARSSVTNKLRLLGLCEPAKEALRSGGLDVSHAKVLLACEPEEQERLTKEVCMQQLSVKQLEAKIKGQRRRELKSDIKQPKEAERLKKILRGLLGKNVEICVGNKMSSQQINISNEQLLNQLIEILEQ